MNNFMNRERYSANNHVVRPMVLRSVRTVRGMWLKEAHQI